MQRESQEPRHLEVPKETTQRAAKKSIQELDAQINALQAQRAQEVEKNITKERFSGSCKFFQTYRKAS